MDEKCEETDGNVDFLYRAMCKYLFYYYIGRWAIGLVCCAVGNLAVVLIVIITLMRLRSKTNLVG